MGLSLRELKEQLIAKQGYTITPAHNQLNDLKVLVDDMMNVRSASPPSSGSGSYSGTNCVGHLQSDYKLSLGDISGLDIKGCSCHTVKDITGYCTGRTYSCSCNSNTPACTCYTRTYSCSCNSNFPVCTCNGRTVTTCDCKSRTSSPDCSARNCSCYINYTNACQCNIFDTDSCVCVSRTVGDGGSQYSCSCRARTAETSCTCNGRTGEPCDCQSRTASCGSRNQSDVTCGSRTADCGSRNTTSCTCNGRCACNSEKRFS